LDTDAKVVKRKRDFIFQAFWINDTECRSVIAHSWLSLPRSIHPISSKLQSVSAALASWSRRKFPRGNQQISILTRQLQVISNQSIGNYDSAEVKRIQTEIQTLWQQKEQYWVMKSRVSWLK